MGHSTTYWVVVVSFFLSVTLHAADTLDPIGLAQEVQASAQNGQQVDHGRSRSRVAGHAGLDSVSSAAVVDCFQSASDFTTLLQEDLARITVDLTVDACRNPLSNATTMVNGSAQLSLGVDRTSRKVISLDHESNQPISGMVSLQRVGDRDPVWQLDLSRSPASMESAFAVELAAGDYLLDVSAEQTTQRDHSTELRVSIVNRGDVNGNEQFDAADLAVVDAILNQDVFVVTVDLDDDGDNDADDRLLWTDGLNSPTILTRPFSVDLDTAESLDALLEDEPTTVAGEAVAIAALPKVIGDIDGDGEVDFVDFLEFSGSFGPNVAFNPRADFDRDGTVGFSDFLIFTREFGDYEPTSVVTPEPTDPAWLLLVAATCWLRVARRRAAGSRT